MKHTLIILALLTATIQTFAQSPRIKLNQITKDSLSGSVLISSPTDSGMVYSRDLYISYGADTFLILGGDTIILQSDLIAEIGDSLLNYVSRTELSDSLTFYVSRTELTDSTTNIRTDIPLIIADSLLNYVTVAGTQNITGAKTFSTDVEIDGKIDLNYDNNVYIGTDVGRIDDGSDNRNVGVGYQALYSNTTGSYNVANGYEALYSHTTGNYNTANGYQALYSNTTGDNNTANGAFAGRYPSTGANNTDGDNSIFIGYDSRPLADAQTNQIVIGSEARGLGSNTAIIGNGSLTDIYNGANNANFSQVSDARDKTNIQPLQLGLNLIKNLNPIAFVWNKRDNTRIGIKDIGFIAQEFDGALYGLPHSDYVDFVKITEDGNWKLNLSDIYPILVKAIQEQQTIIESQSTEIQTLKTLITELSKRLTILENN